LRISNRQHSPERDEDDRDGAGPGPVSPGLRISVGQLCTPDEWHQRRASPRRSARASKLSIDSNTKLEEEDSEMMDTPTY